MTPAKRKQLEINDKIKAIQKSELLILVLWNSSDGRLNTISVRETDFARVVIG